MPSMKGNVAAKCPGGCPEFEAEIYTLVRADEEPDVKDGIIGGEFNLVMCGTCGRLFHHDAPVIYFDPPAEIMAFVFPASGANEEKALRAKIEQDFATLKEGLFREMKIDFEPDIIFGMENLKAFLENEQDLADESDVIESLAEDMGFSVKRIKPSRARKFGVPLKLPYAAQRCDAENLVRASERVYLGHGALNRLKNFIDNPGNIAKII